MRNGFLHFLCHDSTKTFKYNQGLLFKHAVNRENNWIFFCSSWQSLPCLSFFSCSCLVRSIPIGSLLWVLQSGYPFLTSIMASVWLSHQLPTRNSPLVSNPFISWSTYSSYLLWPCCIRGYLRTQLWGKAHRVRKRRLARISLWCTIINLPCLQISLWRTEKYWDKSSLF